ncbi:DUF7024 domain-containing protein [Atlantibacter hermannii]|uniref:DUF7024 domain-containing protein n=1 Tax=Atlantibacter hermannii TaxID=565 RepID=UPI00289A39CD|nr:sugar translocase [Atlantibacter hermannii]
MQNTCVPQPLFYSFKKDWLYFVLGALASIILASVILSGWPQGLIPNFKTPYLYSGDGLSYSWQIQRVIEGWVFNNERVGYPFGSLFYDYPGSDAGNLLIAKLVGLFFHSYVISLNAFVLLSFALVYITSFSVLRSFKFEAISACTFSFIYTFASFHFYRLGHLFFIMYFCAPLYYYYGYRLFTNSLALNKILLPTICVFALSSFGVYYALFGVLIIAFSTLVALFDSKKISSLYPGVILLVAAIIGVLVNIAPNLYYTLSHGVNNEVAIRSSGEAEIYGLKWMQLILPQALHPISSLANVTTSYIAKTPLNNENITSSLGLISSIGFVLVWIGLFIKFTKNIFSPLVNFMIMTVIILFMFGTVGGLGSLFAILISSSIRGWNRISIFIQFGSLCLFMIALNSLLAKFKISRPVGMVLACIFTVIGCYDQIPKKYYPATHVAASNYLLDSGFIKEIESEIPQGSAVYQLPYMAFPEVPHLYRLETYSLATGFLNSSTLKWSYSGMKGREGDIFYRHLSELTPAEQLDAIENLGFAGIYIDKRGYEDSGAQIVKEFMALLPGAKVITRSDNNIVFIPITHPKKVDFKGMSNAEIINVSGYKIDRLGVRYKASLSDGIDFTKKGFPEFIHDVSGLSVSEPWGRWSDSESVNFELTKPLGKVRISGEILLG